MKRVFISYSRFDRAEVQPLYELVHDQLMQDVFLDQRVRGGEDWWNQILAAIANCHVFIAILSPNSLQSTACRYERDYAHAMRRPIVPVSVGAVNMLALPPDLARQQIVPYPSDPGTAMAFSRAVIDTPLPPPPPAGVAPPPVPLSYLSDVAAQVSRPQLSGDQQARVFELLAPALRAADPDERDGARSLLEQLGGRRDLTNATRYSLKGIGVLPDTVIRPLVSPPAREPIWDPPPPPPPPQTSIAQPRRMSTGAAVFLGIAIAFVLLILLVSC
jgi:hypothetical protein